MNTPHPSRRALALLATLAALIFSGCTTYAVKVDAISRPPAAVAELTSYKIRNANPAIDSNSLRYKEAVQHIKTALSGRGLWEAPDAASAEMIVDFDYGIGPSHTDYVSIDVPVVSPPNVPFGTEIPLPSIGTEQLLIPVATSSKHVTVSCRENIPAGEGKPPRELWRIDASIESEGRNLRECLPVLASVVMDHIGTTTAGIATVPVRANADSVLFIKNGP